MAVDKEHTSREFERELRTLRERLLAMAEQVIANDAEIDTLNMHLIADVISLSADNHEDVARSLALSSVSRYLERIGDHATNIAEMVIYFVRGRDVRHHLPPRQRG